MTDNIESHVGVCFHGVLAKQVKFDIVNFVVGACDVLGMKKGAVVVHLVSNKEMVRVNKSVFGRDYVTDIISLNYAEPPEIQGELFVAVRRVKRQARSFGHSPDRELKFVLVHGLLHLLGARDDTPEARRNMWDRQLAVLGVCE